MTEPKKVIALTCCRIPRSLEAVEQEQLIEIPNDSKYQSLRANRCFFV